MKHAIDLMTDRRWWRTTVLVGGLALALFLWPVAASAGHGHGRSGKHGNYHGRGHAVVVQRYERHHERHHQRGYASHRRFVVPRSIHTYRVRSYRPYYYGRVYYAPHRHYHTLYSFPVYGYGEPIYYPYAYCGDSLFARGVFTAGGPHFSINLSIVR